MMYILIDNYVFYSCMTGQIGLKVESGMFETPNVLLMLGGNDHADSSCDRAGVDPRS